MKASYLLMIISGAAVISILSYLLLFSAQDKISWNASKLANETALQHGIFSHEVTWHVHIASNGELHVVTDNHQIDKNLTFSCLFSTIPNDGKDHFAYISVFRNNNTGYMVALDDQTGKIIDAKPVQYESAVCGP